MKHYLVTGFGSSGTKFLAQMIDRSMWASAYHEHCKEWDKEEKAKDFYEAKQREHEAVGLTYVDVNSHMRNIMLSNLGINVVYIDRHPEQLLMSWYPHKRQKWADDKKKEDRWFENIEKWLQLRSVIEKHRLVNKIDFRLMTSDLNYLQNLVYEFGGIGVTVTKKDMYNKVNSHNKGRIKRYSEVPKEYRDRLEKIIKSI